jgi:tetratricopeptide (TPR) repeat protein
MLGIFFSLLILFYSYLPIRASQNPILNWGNTIDVERILRHISGKQYQVWLFSSFDSAKKQLLFFFNNLPSELTINLILSIIGLFLSYFKARRFFVLTLILLISTIFYSINYDIVDIDTYFLLAYFALSMFAAFGIVLIFDWLKHKKLNNNLAAITIFVFISVHVGLTFNKVNQSDIYIFEDYTKELLASSDHNSIIFSYQWDYFLSASYYFQFVEDYRRDLIIIDKELLRRSWYYNQLENYHPGIISSLQPTVDQFLQALKPFERSENFNPQLLESLFQKIMTDLVAVNYDKRTFYIAPEVFENEMQKGQFALPEGYTLVPDIFFFKVNKGGEYLPAKDPEFSIRFPEKRNYYHDTIEKLIGGMLVRRALYEMQYDKLQRAKVYIKKLKKEFPDYPVPKGLTEVINRSTANIE